MHHAHKTNLFLFFIWNESNKALKSQLIAAADGCFIRTLKDKELRYDNVTSLEIVTHLFATYSMISNSDIKLNEEKMTSPWTPPKPI